MSKAKAPRRRQRSKWAKTVTAVSVAALVGGLAYTATMSANAAGFCAVPSCGGPALPSTPVEEGGEPQNSPLTGQGFSAEEARNDATNECQQTYGGQATITREYSEPDEEGTLFFADADCLH